MIFFAATTPPQRAVVIPEIESKIIVSGMAMFHQQWLGADFLEGHAVASNTDAEK